MKYCIDCGKKITKIATRCLSCNRKYYIKFHPDCVKRFDNNNGSYKDGRTLKDYYCRDCNKKLKSYQNQGRCLSCFQKKRFSLPSNHPNYIDGRTLKKTFCIDCSILIKSYKAKRCKKCETIRRLKLKIWKKSKNKPEKKLQKLLNKIVPNEYKYVGDGEIIIDSFCPDFINYNNQKKIIELYGDYWHNRKEVIKRDKRRLKIYKQYGYQTLIIWENELENINILKEKILKFDKE